MTWLHLWHKKCLLMFSQIHRLITLDCPPNICFTPLKKLFFISCQSPMQIILLRDNKQTTFGKGKKQEMNENEMIEYRPGMMLFYDLCSLGVVFANNLTFINDEETSQVLP